MTTTMLYKSPGPHEIHGGKFDYTIVEDDQIEAAKADGWHLTTPEAKQAYDDDQAGEAAARAQAVEVEAAKALADGTKPPTREELEQVATKLGIAFSPRTSDKKLRAQVEAAAQPDTTTEA